MLPKKQRLTRDREIRGVLKTKQYESKNPLFYLVGKDNFLEISRLTVVTPKRLGKATIRNRLRRVFAEAYSKIRHKIKKNVDLVVFPRQAAVDKHVREVALALGNALKRCYLC